MSISTPTHEQTSSDLRLCHCGQLHPSVAPPFDPPETSNGFTWFVVSVVLLGLVAIFTAKRD
jgi:hypothetical protein